MANAPLVSTAVRNWTGLATAATAAGAAALWARTALGANDTAPASAITHGQPDGEGSIQGTWHIGPFDSGPFLLRPAVLRPAGLTATSLPT